LSTFLGQAPSYFLPTAAAAIVINTIRETRLL
jgi:hypothetical protein